MGEQWVPIDGRGWLSRVNVAATMLVGVMPGTKGNGSPPQPYKQATYGDFCMLCMVALALLYWPEEAGNLNNDAINAMPGMAKAERHRAGEHRAWLNGGRGNRQRV